MTDTKQDATKYPSPEQQEELERELMEIPEYKALLVSNEALLAANAAYEAVLKKIIAEATYGDKWTVGDCATLANDVLTNKGDKCT